MKRPGIPAVPQTNAETAQFLTALKENIELSTGVRQGKLPLVSKTATLSEVFTALNAVIDRMNAG